MRIGIVALGAYFLVYAIVFWMYISGTQILPIMQYSYFAGSLSITCMAFALILSVRPRVMEDYFGGLDKMYQVHKYLGISAMLLFLLHFGTADDGGGGPDDEAAPAEVATAPPVTNTATTTTVPAANDAASSGTVVASETTATNTTADTIAAESVSSTPDTVVEDAATATTTTEPTASATAVDAVEATGIMARLEEIYATLGLIAMVGFIILIILTLNRKIPYHRWMPTHRFMGVLYMIVSAHALISMFRPVEMSITSPPGVMIGVMVTAGILSYIYKELVYPLTQQHPFSLVEVNRLNRASELVFEAKSRRFDFKPGQFIFVRIKNEGFDEAHPFTISSSSTDSRLRVTMKTLGDFTRRVRDKLQVGADVSIEGPYGRFNPLDNGLKQVWVAGGIGITPFLATLRSLKPDNKAEIHLFYCVRELDEALFLDEMQKIAAEINGIHIHLFDSSTGTLLTARAVADALKSPLAGWNYSFCGPKPLTNAIANGLNKLGVSRSKMHYEVFEMR